MGRGEPVGAMLTSLLFGTAHGLSTKVAGLPNVSSFLVSMIPYAVTILGLFIYAWNRTRKLRKRGIRRLTGI
jgi:ABC-type uncharacterized transport system permease subunit